MLHGSDVGIKLELHVNRQRMTSRQKPKSNHYHFHEDFPENINDHERQSKISTLSKVVE